MTQPIDFAPGSVAVRWFNTRAASGAPATLAGTPALLAERDDGTTSTAGLTLTVDAGGVTGLHVAEVDTAADGAFYAAGRLFTLRLTAGTVSGTSVVGYLAAEFGVGRTAALVWSALRAAHAGAGTFGEALQTRSGAVVTATANSITLPGGFSDARFVKRWILARDQVRRLGAFASGSYAIAPAWAATPEDGSDFLMLGAAGMTPGDVWDEPRSAHLTAGTFGEAVQTSNGAITAAEAGSVTLPAPYNDARYSGRWVVVNDEPRKLGTFAAGKFSVAPAWSPVPTAGDPFLILGPVGASAAEVWDEPRSAHAGAGTFGEAVQTADGAIVAAEAGTVTLPGGYANARYTGRWVMVGDQPRKLGAFAAGKFAVAPNWSPTPTPGDPFLILGPVGATAADVWDEPRAGHATAGTFGEAVLPESGSIVSAEPGTVTLPAPYADARYAKRQVVVGGQSRTLGAFASGKFAVAPAWSPTPPDGSPFRLLGGPTYLDLTQPVPRRSQQGITDPNLGDCAQGAWAGAFAKEHADIVPNASSTFTVFMPDAPGNVPWRVFNLTLGAGNVPITRA